LYSEKEGDLSKPLGKYVKKTSNTIPYTYEWNKSIDRLGKNDYSCGGTSILPRKNKSFTIKR
jgi:hypothetical protein